MATTGALLATAVGCTPDCEVTRSCGLRRVLSDGGSGGGGAGAGGQGGSLVPGQALWGYRFGDGSDQTALAVAVDDSGRVAFGGAFSGTVNIGSDMFSSNGSEDALLAVLSGAGAVVSSKQFGSANAEQVQVVATIGDDIIVAGDFADTLSVGGPALISSGVVSMFVARFSGTGQHVWSRALGGAGDHHVTAMAVDPATGNIALAGTFDDALFDGATTTTTAGGSDGFAIFLNGDGDTLSSVTIGGSQDDAVEAATWASGDLVLAGHFRGAVDFGDAMRTSAGATDAFVMRLKLDTQTVWSQQHGNSAAQTASALAANANVIAFGGWLEGSANFGGGTVPDAVSEDGFVVALDHDGSFQWQRIISGMGDQRVNGLALTAAGEVTAVGHFTEQLTVGEQHSAQGQQDAFALRLDDAGKLRWLRVIGAATTTLKAVAHDSTEHAVSAGTSTSLIALDGVELEPFGGEDGFVLKLSP